MLNSEHTHVVRSLYRVSYEVKYTVWVLLMRGEPEESDFPEQIQENKLNKENFSSFRI